MPTFAYTPTFGKDFALLDPADKQRFKRKVTEEFVPDLEVGKFRAGRRVKGVHGAQGVFEMTWAPDGRATFEYGEEQIPGKPHVIWRRVGTHDVFRRDLYRRAHARTRQQRMNLKLTPASAPGPTHVT